jgi:hypothetical protein
MRSQIYEWFHGHGIPFSLSHEEMHRGYDRERTKCHNKCNHSQVLSACTGNGLDQHHQWWWAESGASTTAHEHARNDDGGSSSNLAESMPSGEARMNTVSSEHQVLRVSALEPVQSELSKALHDNQDCLHLTGLLHRLMHVLLSVPLLLKRKVVLNCIVCKQVWV